MENKEFVEVENLENEEWRDVVGYEGLYCVSTLGRVYNTQKGVINKQYANKNGYMYVSLRKKDKENLCTVHRLVATAFIENPFNKKCVDHIDGDRRNNRLSNLRWCTHIENNANPITRERMSLGAKHRFTTEDGHKKRRGTGKGKHTLNNSHSAVAVLQKDKEGNLIKEWDCIKRIEIELGYCYAYIRMCLTGTRPFAYGYKWEYRDGERRSYNTKNLTNKKKKIIKYDINGSAIKEYNSIKEACEDNQITAHCIRLCINGHREYSCGYVWKFAD